MKSIIAAPAAVLAIGVAAGAASANTHGCNYPYNHGPTNDQNVNIGNVSVRNMACSTALRAISNSTLLRNGNIGTPGYGCHKQHTYQAMGTILGADIRCSRRTGQAFRFSWGT